MKLHSIAGLIALLAVPQVVGANQPTPPLGPRDISGDYRVEGKAGVVLVRHTSGQFYVLRCIEENWEGVGVLDETTYLGVFRYGTGATGRHTIDFTDPGQARVTGTYTNVKPGEFRAAWKPIPPVGSRLESAPPVIVTNPADPDRPKFGEYVYVEELPEAITKVAPAWPEGSRESAGGTVMVQALVMKDGTVGDTKIVGSLPGFDDAAMAAVRQWKFKPAMAKGKPVAVWVAIPVKFSVKWPTSLLGGHRFLISYDSLRPPAGRTREV